MWVSIPNEVRWQIRRIFGIPQSSNVVVNDGKIETDGTTTEDFRHLTVGKMQEYLGDTSDDFHKLLDKVIARITDEIWGNRNQAVAVSSDDGVNIAIDQGQEKSRKSKSKVKNA